MKTAMSHVVDQMDFEKSLGKQKKMQKKQDRDFVQIKKFILFMEKET